MTAAAVVYAALVLVFAASARWLSRVHITAPIAFVIAGAVIAAAVPSSTVGTAGDIKAVAEVTLALILFHDAAQVRPRQIDADRGLVLRLLLVGLPLTVVVGFLAARVVFPAMPVMLALLLAAALAPTDAGLGAATVLNPVVPVRVRRVLNVESGLNDGLITPWCCSRSPPPPVKKGYEPGSPSCRGCSTSAWARCWGPASARGVACCWAGPGVMT